MHLPELGYRTSFERAEDFTSRTSCERARRGLCNVVNVPVDAADLVHRIVLENSKLRNLQVVLVLIGLIINSSTSKHHYALPVTSYPTPWEWDLNLIEIRSPIACLLDCEKHWCHQMVDLETEA